MVTVTAYAPKESLAITQMQYFYILLRTSENSVKVK